MNKVIQTSEPTRAKERVIFLDVLRGFALVGILFANILSWSGIKFIPFEDIIENTTITSRNTGGTDHQSFDALSLPGFQFIQDPIEYWSRTHHTNMDTYERLVLDDLKQMSVIVAAFVYNTAQRDEKLPRKPIKQLD